MQYVDVLPTLVELSGGVPGDLDIDGKSFAPVLRGDRTTHSDYVFGLQTTRGIYSGSEYALKASGPYATAGIT